MLWNRIELMNNLCFRNYIIIEKIRDFLKNKSVIKAIMQLTKYFHLSE